MGEFMTHDSFKIRRFTVYTVEIPMRFNVSHAMADRKDAKNILVCTEGENDLAGWGECCPRIYVTGETVDTVKAELTENILPAMIGKSFSSLDELTEYLTAYVGGIKHNCHAAFCAAELAVLDLAGKTFGKSAGDIIGPQVHRKVRYSGVIATSDPGKAGKYARLMSLFGFREIKVKVSDSLDVNLRLLEIIRKIVGLNMSLRIDANCAWSGDEALRQIEAMKKFKLDGVEQPVAGNDLEGMKQVTAAKLLPVVADESLCSISDAEKLIAHKACDVFNIRLSKCGGLINSLAIYRRAIDVRLDCQLGAHVGETAVLSAAGRHIATRCRFIKWLEGSYGKLLLKQDIARPDMTIGFGGRAKCVNRPGLGVQPVKKRIEKYQADSIEID